jgi:3-hydroxybutyryl-CoA dehydrogenase
MTLVVLGNDVLNRELQEQGLDEHLKVEWISEVSAFADYLHADGYIDLLFEPDEGRIEQLRKLPARPVIISSVTRTLTGLPENFIRINGWNSFLRRTIIEASALTDEARKGADTIFEAFHKKVAWVPDIPGFLTARVIAMIINEAYFALAEEVSTKEEMDIAMKLGTNYPYGPFEWSERIGLQKVAELLDCLFASQDRYQPAPLLKTQTTA